MKTNYEITIGYNAVITVQVKADGREEAERKALDRFSNRIDKIVTQDVQIQDHNYKSDGVLDMDATWNNINR